MNEWQLFYSDKDRGTSTLVGGVVLKDLKSAIPSENQGIRASDILFCSFNLYNGPNYVKWYCKGKAKKIEIRSDGYWKLRFYTNINGSMQKYGFDMFFRCENVQYDTSTDSIVYRLIPKSYHTAQGYVDYSWSGNGRNVLEIIDDMLKQTNRDRVYIEANKQVVHYVKKFGMNRFIYKGKVCDAIDNLCKRYNLVYYYMNNKLYIDRETIRLKTNKNIPKFTLTKDMISLSNGVYNATFYHGIVTPGVPIIINGITDRVMSTTYYCDDASGSVCTVMLYGDNATAGRDEIYRVYKEYTSYVHNKFDKHIPDSPFPLKIEEMNDFDAYGLNINSPNYVGNSLINIKSGERIVDMHNIDNLPIWKWTFENKEHALRNKYKYAKVMRMTPYCGYNSKGKPFGLSYPSVDRGMGICLPVNGNMDESILIGSKWINTSVRKEYDEDFRMTFNDGTTIYESSIDRSLIVVPGKRLSIAINSEIDGDKNVANVDGNLLINGKPVKNKIDIDKNSINMNIGDSFISITENGIEIGVGSTKLIINNGGVRIV